MAFNPFMIRGDSDTLELTKKLRIGTVKFVDKATCTVKVEWADKKGGRDVIPISMPFVEQAI